MFTIGDIADLGWTIIENSFIKSIKFMTNTHIFND